MFGECTGDDDKRKGENDIDDAHHHAVDFAAEVRRDGAVRRTERTGHQRNDERDVQRLSRAAQDQREVVVSDLIRAHRIRR
ncbi:MAG TPA: hypothetical protein VE132_00310 [Micromonosporaceae bacterium]|nr:hypothetical protein [Micromonosporaceae bacterium]